MWVSSSNNKEPPKDLGQGLMWSEQSLGRLAAWGGCGPRGQLRTLGSSSALHLGLVVHVSVSSESPGWVSAYTKISLETAPRPVWSGQACLARMLGSRPNTSWGQESECLAHSFPAGQLKADSKQGWLPSNQRPHRLQAGERDPGGGTEPSPLRAGCAGPQSSVPTNGNQVLAH